MKLTAFLVLGAALLAFQPAFADEEKSPVHALMEESGLVAQTGGFGAWFDKEVGDSARRIRELDAASIDALLKIAADAVDDDSILADTERALTLTLTPQQIDSLRAFYGSPLGQEARRAEVAGSTPEVAAEINGDDGGLRAQAAKDVERTEIFRRMDAIFFASSGSARLFAMVDTVVVSAVASERLHGDVPPGFAAFVWRQAATLRKDLLKTMQEQTLASLTRIYRDLSTAELRAYLDYLETGPPEEFYAALDAAASKILEDRIDEINSEFAVYARQQKT